MRLRYSDDNWAEYDVYFNGERDTSAYEADTNYQFILKQSRDGKPTRYYGNVHLVHRATGKVTT